MIRFKEWLLEQASNLLEDTVIFEMAESRAHAEKVVRGLSRPIVLHLIKVLYWEDSDNYSKHIKDINNWLYEIAEIELKPNNKKPKENDFYLWLWDGPFGNGYEKLYTKVILRALSDYIELPRTNLTEEELYIKLEVMFMVISKDLSKDSFTKIEDYIK